MYVAEDRVRVVARDLQGRGGRFDRCRFGVIGIPDAAAPGQTRGKEASVGIVTRESRGLLPMIRAFAVSHNVPIHYASGSSRDLAPASLPEWDDIPKTNEERSPYAVHFDDATPQAPDPIVEPAPAAEKSASYVRMRNLEDTTQMPPEWTDACAFLDAMGELQLNLTVNLHCLESSVLGATYDRSANAAAETLRTRIQELTDLRDALNELYFEATDASLAPLFAADAQLTAYLKGTYLWCNEITSALTELSNTLQALQPDWFTLRTRLDRAAMWYFDGLPNEVRVETERHAIRPDFVAKVEEVFFAARYLAHGLEKKFG